LPYIQLLHDKYSDDGLIILAISSDRNEGAVRLFLEKNNYTFQVLIADGKVQKDYQIRGIPTVYMIDRDGVVRFHHVGYDPLEEKDFERHIKELLEK
ncbi:TlpA family protein disulfide reductase, partial [Candidatus Latescibacterota bacterium]